MRSKGCLRPDRPSRRVVFDWHSCSVVLAGALWLAAAGIEAPAQSADASAQAEIAEGVQLLRSGQADAAKAKFNVAIQAAPRSADALTWRGISENQTQQYVSAAADFRAALRFAPAALAAHYNLALSLIRLHETDAAIEQLRVVIAAQPGAVPPLYNLAILLESKGLFSAAEEQLKKAHALQPEDKGVTLHLLMDGLKSKDVSAVPSLVSDLRSPSTPPTVEREAGLALLTSARFSDAISLFEASREREDTAPDIDLLLARAYLGDGMNREAAALLEITKEQAGDEQDYLLGLAYLGLHDTLKAAEMFKAARHLDARDARPAYHLGLIIANMPGQQGEAAKLFRSAMELEPDNEQYALALARVLLADDHAEEAKDLLLKMPEKALNTSERHMLIGVALAATHAVTEAVPQLQMVVMEDPKLALAQNVLGFCLFQEGQYVQAAAAYGRASELEPGRSLYAHDAALAFERADQNAQALHFAERASAAASASAQDHALLGKLYAASGRNQDAVRELRHAAEMNPELDSAYYLLARTYMQMGDRQQATQWSDKLRALKQRHETAFSLQKKEEAAPVRSSTLLDGSSLDAEGAGTP